MCKALICKPISCKTLISCLFMQFKYCVICCSYDKTLPDFLRPFTALSVYTRIINQGVELLQRRKEYTQAVSVLRKLLSQQVYCVDYRGHWWERLALNYDAHLKNQEKVYPLEFFRPIPSMLSAFFLIYVEYKFILTMKLKKLLQVTRENSNSTVHNKTEKV